jgi:hypothetical protein
MDISTFDQEMKRLLDQWPTAYSEQRRKIFFNTFRNVSNFDFRDAVTYCLGNYRSAPLLPEMMEAVNKSVFIRKEQERRDEDQSRAGFFGIVGDPEWCDPEFQKNCSKLYWQYANKQITKAQFDEGCALLDEAAKIYTKKKNRLPEKYTKPVFDEDKPF